MSDVSLFWHDVGIRCENCKLNKGKVIYLETFNRAVAHLREHEKNNHKMHPDYNTYIELMKIGAIEPWKWGSSKKEIYGYYVP